MTEIMDSACYKENDNWLVWNSSTSQKEQQQQQFVCDTRNFLKKADAGMKSIHTLDNGSSGEFSPILTCLRSIQGSSEALWGSEKMNLFKKISFKELKKERNINCEDGFCFAVSLQDGSTLYISSAITKHLGYPKDMLVGQCIMNFLYQKDHITFANHLTQGLNACFTQGNKDESHLVQNTFFCRLRVYHGLQFGYGISHKKTQYKPFKVTLHVNDLIFDDVCVEKSNSMLCVKATATPLSSAYQVPEEIPAMTSFSTRHTASCHFSHVDASAIPYIGYLPQDLIGYSIFDFYHADDLPQLKDTYEIVMKRPGLSFRSEPYRFKVFNGCYITLETEWSCYINPWSKKLEFIVGQHRVMKGPTDIKIFNPCEMKEVSEEIQNRNQSIENDIKNMLAQPINKDYTGDKINHLTNKRKREIASFVHDFIEDGCRSKKVEGTENMHGIQNSDFDSVVMGDISPHQDSSTSSETPSTFQKSNLEDTMERFFASQEKLPFSNSSEESKSDEKLSNSDESGGNGSKQPESVPSASGSNEASPNKNQGSDSTSSKGNLSYLNGDSGYQSIDKNMTPSITVSDTCKADTWDKNESASDTGKFLPCIGLTEEMLSQHNRLNHKHAKHRKCKGNVCHTTHKDYCKTKHNESSLSNTPSSLHKPKKYARIQEATEVIQAGHLKVTSSQEKQPTPSLNNPFSYGTFAIPVSPFSGVSMPSAPISSAFAVPSVPYVSPSPTPGSPSTPVFIPVMYMGPCLSPLTNVIPQSSMSLWPYPPVTPFSTPAMLPASMIPNGGALSLPIIPTPHASTAPNVCTVQSSGITATTTVSKTTTTIAPGLLLGNQKSSCKNEKVESLLQIDDNCIFFGESKDNDDFSFSFISSPTKTEYQFKNEEMEFDSESNKCQRPIRQDPSWLAGVELTSDVVYRYKIEPRNVDDVLMKDMEALRGMPQPDLVNKQLGMLHEEYKEEMKGEQNGEEGDNDFNMTDSALLGLTTTENKESQMFEDCEDNLFHAGFESI